jgi:CBS domain containing-hemolysin-like protein
MTAMIFIIFIALCLATYLSALNISLMNMSRAALQQEVSDKGRPSSADWLFDQLDSAMLATALCRTLVRMSIYIFVLAALLGLRDAPRTVTWSGLVAAGLIAAAFIWFTTIVLGTAIARHFSIKLIASNLSILHAITLVCRPLTKAGLLVDRIFARLTRSRNHEEAEAELLQSIEDVQREGGLDIQSAEILENVVEFNNTEASQVMTPRTEIEGIEYTDNLGSIRAFIANALHSRIPVFRGTVDNIIGILYLKDLIKYLGKDASDFRLAPLLRQPIVVPETKPVRELLNVFQHGEVHMAIVIDEYGSTAGLVTIEDVLEQIVGDIRDEHEPQQHGGPMLQTIDETHAEVDGRFRIHELNEQLQLELPENGDYDTVAGYVLAHWGRVPTVGETFEAHNARFTALAATPTHLRRIGIELLQPASASNGDPLHQDWVK